MIDYFRTIKKYIAQAAEMAEIEAELGNKPDIVRLVHTNRSKTYSLTIYDSRTELKIPHHLEFF